MTEDDLKLAVAAILAMLYESDDHEAIESLCYLALQEFNSQVYTLDAYRCIVAVMVDAKMVAVSNSKLVIRPNGIEIAERLEDRLGS